MKRFLVILPLFLFFEKCNGFGKDIQNSKDTIIHDTVIIKNNAAGLQPVYRNLLEESIDTFSVKDIPFLFGTWTITSVANPGANFYSDSVIMAQLGKHVYFDSFKALYPLPMQQVVIQNPQFSFDLRPVDNYSKGLKGTTFWYGFRPCRKNVVMLNISKRYFEIITYNEMVFFDSGVFYFMNKHIQ